MDAHTLAHFKIWIMNIFKLIELGELSSCPLGTYRFEDFQIQLRHMDSTRQMPRKAVDKADFEAEGFREKSEHI